MIEILEDQYFKDCSLNFIFIDDETFKNATYDGVEIAYQLYAQMMGWV